MVHAVSAVFFLLTFAESDPFGVRAPLWSRATDADSFGRELFLCNARFCFGDVKLCGRITIRTPTVSTTNGIDTNVPARTTPASVNGKVTPVSAAIGAPTRPRRPKAPAA